MHEHEHIYSVVLCVCVFVCTFHGRCLKACTVTVGLGVWHASSSCRDECLWLSAEAGHSGSHYHRHQTVGVCFFSEITF